jgi:hypothetical protein
LVINQLALGEVEVPAALCPRGDHPGDVAMVGLVYNRGGHKTLHPLVVGSRAALAKVSLPAQIY